jgi:hypothetical protein
MKTMPTAVVGQPTTSRLTAHVWSSASGIGVELLAFQ